MRRYPAPGQYFAYFSLGLLSLQLETALAKAETTHYHQDHRRSFRLKLNPETNFLSQSLDPETIAVNYLKAEGSQLGLNDNLEGLRFVKMRESLSGYHLYFGQDYQGIPIDKAEIIISIGKSDRHIYKIYNNLQPITMGLSANKISLNLDEAYDRAWKFLAVRGELFEAPVGRLHYVIDGDRLRAVFQIELSTTAPYGAFRLEIDADTGEIIHYEDQRISHKPVQALALLSKGTGPLMDRQKAFANWQSSEKKLPLAAAQRANGQALVFDPDPRSTLLDQSLQDDANAERFQAAYMQAELKDLRYDGSRYFLEGPWVKVIDWDLPRTPPSSSLDGSWTARRGENAFNDAMTYYHIDKSQRYLQSLGFVGAKGIQQGPIEVDSDGVNGDDNSFFQPSSNRLSFGHGCVDDNEDADVILHEYGHALHFGINKNWSGGDTGAMGEGFGDYWAASYGLSASKGAEFFPNQIYSWDGHGEGNLCWPGRILNALAARYEPSSSYPAHTTIAGGFQSDELWSTPLFQSLLQLKAQGIPREEVDSIVLEAQFGMGTGVTMPDMAESIVATAQRLFTGPHASVFKDNFLRHNIIELPKPVLKASLAAVKDSGGNTVLDPGEEIELSFSLVNTGKLAASKVRASLVSQDSSSTIIAGRSSFPELLPGQTANNLEALRLKVGSTASCGSILRVMLTIDYAEGESISLPLELRIGQGIGARQESSPKLPIPDGSSKGVIDTISVSGKGLVSDQLKIGVNIKHSYRGDLRLVLTSPSGTQIVLQDRSGIGTDDLIGSYPSTLTPKESLSKLRGEPIEGVWQLQVSDLARSDAGTFQSWSFDDITGYVCQ